MSVPSRSKTRKGGFTNCLLILRPEEVGGRAPSVVGRRAAELASPSPVPSIEAGEPQHESHDAIRVAEPDRRHAVARGRIGDSGGGAFDSDRSDSGTPELDLRDRQGLVSLDQDEIAGGELALQQLGELLLRAAAPSRRSPRRYEGRRCCS